MIDSNLSVPEIILYNWQSANDVDVSKIASFLTNTFDVSSTIGSGFDRQRISLESCRVTDIQRRFGHERKDAKAPSDAPPLYDGHEVLSKVNTAGLDTGLTGPLCIIVTDLLVCTYDDGDARYHARPVVAANTSLISTASMIWGPARSGQYYEDVMMCAHMQGNLEDVELQHASIHLTRGDSRMQQVAEGYAMQAVFYGVTHETFCDSPDCRLYNTHLQSEMIDAQMNAELCKRHRQILDGLT